MNKKMMANRTEDLTRIPGDLTEHFEMLRSLRAAGDSLSKSEYAEYENMHLWRKISVISPAAHEDGPHARMRITELELLLSPEQKVAAHAKVVGDILANSEIGICQEFAKRYSEKDTITLIKRGREARQRVFSGEIEFGDDHHFWWFRRMLCIGCGSQTDGFIKLIFNNADQLDKTTEWILPYIRLKDSEEEVEDHTEPAQYVPICIYCRDSANRAVSDLLLGMGRAEERARRKHALRDHSGFGQ
jgi:hypothetical protein